MKPKIITIGRIAVASFEIGADMTAFAEGVDSNSILYTGSVDGLREATAQKIAPLHEDFMQYHADALATLWKGMAKFKDGTESALLAVKSYIYTAHRLPFIVIWRPLKADCERL